MTQKNRQGSGSLLNGLACLFLFLAAIACRPLLAQSGILDPNLEVAEPLRQLDTQLQEQLKTWFEVRDVALRGAGRSSFEYFKANREFNPIAFHGEAILDYAKAHPGSPEALSCLAYLVEWGEGQPEELFDKVAAELLVNHRDNPALSSICLRCVNAYSVEPFSRFLKSLSLESDDLVVRATSELALAQLYDNCLDLKERMPAVRNEFEEAGLFAANPNFRKAMDELDAMDAQDLIQQRDALLAGLAEKWNGARPWVAIRTFGRLDYRFEEASDGLTIADRAESLAYEVANLRVGCTAPKFDGTLVDGTPFRLAARRGQPVLLVFSFKGCSACEAMHPALRNVQRKYSDFGFSVVGVLVDAERDAAQSVADSEDVTWPCVWDGASGPIAHKYRVKAFPTVYLLDAKGQIVARNLHYEAELTRVIDELFGEPE